jgi:hypothetical protein
LPQCRVPPEIAHRRNDRVPDPRVRPPDFTDLVWDVVHDAKTVVGSDEIAALISPSVVPTSYPLIIITVIRYWKAGNGLDGTDPLPCLPIG